LDFGRGGREHTTTQPRKTNQDLKLDTEANLRMQKFDIGLDLAVYLHSGIKSNLGGPSRQSPGVRERTMSHPQTLLPSRIHAVSNRQNVRANEINSLLCR
jgi:hypothetical protein